MDRTYGKIVKKGSQFCVVSEDGSKNLGCYSTKEAAVKRLGEVEFFKKQKGKGTEMTRRPSDEELLAKALGGPKVVDTKSVTSKPSALRDDPAGGRTKTDLAGAGTVAGITSEKVIDGKDHFPISTENAAKSAVHRVSRLNQSPDWFMGTVAELAELVGRGVSDKHPTLNVSVAMQFDRVLASVGKSELVGSSDTELRVDEIKNPGNVNPKEVPSVPTPSLRSTSQVIATLEANPQLFQSFAMTLPEKIDKKMEALKTAKTLAERLLKDGLTGEEFGKLMGYLQEDILHDLLMIGTTASDKKDQLLAKMEEAKKKKQKGYGQ